MNSSTECSAFTLLETWKTVEHDSFHLNANNKSRIWMPQATTPPIMVVSTALNLFICQKSFFFYLPLIYVSLRAPEWPLITFGLLYLHLNQACVFSWIPFSCHSVTIICHPTSNKLVHKNLKSAKLKLFLHTTKTTSSLCKLDHFLTPDCSDFAHLIRVCTPNACQHQTWDSRLGCDVQMVTYGEHIWKPQQFY